MPGPRVTQGVRVPLFDRLAANAEPDRLRAPRASGVAVLGMTEADAGRCAKPEHQHAGNSGGNAGDERPGPVTPIPWASYRRPAPRENGAAEQGVPRMLDRRGLAASIARELDRLLNTRTPLPADELGRRPRSTLDYGLPDLSLFWPLTPHSEARLAALIADTVAAFEPRLLNPRVAVERIAGPQRALRALVAGEIVLDGMTEPVTFPVKVSDGVEDHVGDPS